MLGIVGLLQNTTSLSFLNSSLHRISNGIRIHNYPSFGIAGSPSYRLNQGGGGAKKAVRDLISISKEIAKEEVTFAKEPESMSRKELEKLITKVEKQMRKAAAELDFESAAVLRDKMAELRKNLDEIKGR